MKYKSVKSFNLWQSLPDRQAGVMQTYYDIVKAHGGELKVGKVHMEGLPADLSVRNEVKAEASEQAGSEFIIQLPID